MSDQFEQPKKPTLFRSFESDVAKTLGIQKEEASSAILEKKNQYEQKIKTVRTQGAKRLFFVVLGLVFLIAGVGASLFLYQTYTKTHTTATPSFVTTVSFEVSQEKMSQVIPILQELLNPKKDGVFRILFTKSETPLSLPEVYALLPLKKGDNKSADFDSFSYLSEKKESIISPVFILRERTSTFPQVPAQYDDFVLSIAISHLDLSEEAKSLLPEERFSPTFVNNIPVRSISVQTEKGEEGVVFGRTFGTAHLFIMTKKSLRSGLFERMLTDAIVLSL